MRYPSIKTLMRLPDVTPDTAREIRWILATAKREEITEKYATARKYENSCYNPPEKFLLKLYAINSLIGTYGIESFCFPEESYSNCRTPKIAVDYCNAGDPYVTTLVRVTNNDRGSIAYRVTGWGDIAERFPSRD